MNRSLYNNIRVIYLMGFCTGLTVVIPVFVPLLQGHGLSMEQILQTQALYALTVSLSARYASTLESRLGTRGLLALVASLPIIALLGMAFADGWAGVLFGFGMQLSRGLSMSLFYEALNRRVPGDFRATVNSLVSLGVRALFIATGPLLGYALDALGTRWVLLALTAAFAPLLALVLIPLVVRIRREAATGAAVAPVAAG